MHIGRAIGAAGLAGILLAGPAALAVEPAVIARLGSDRFRQAGVVEAVAYSPDGKTLATAGKDAVHLWDAADGRRLRSVPVTDHLFFALRFTPDGKALYAAAASGEDTRLCRIDPAAGKLTDTRPAGPAKRLGTFSPDARWLAVRTDREAILHVIDTATGQNVFAQVPFGDVYQALAFRPDGGALAAGTGKGRVVLYEPRSGKALHEFGVGGEVRNMTFSPDGKDLVAELWEPDRVVRVDATSGKARWTHATARAGHLTFSADGKAVFYFGSAGPVREVGRWHWLDAATGGPLDRVLDADSGHAVAVRPDGRVLALGGYDGLTAQWDLVTHRRLDASADPSKGVIDLGFSPDGTKVRGWARGWYEWDVKTGRQTRLTPPLDVGETGKIVVSPDQRWLGTFGGGRIDLPREFYQTDLRTGRQVRTLDRIEGYGLLRFLPDGSLVASGGTGLVLAGPPPAGPVRRIDTRNSRAALSEDSRVAAAATPVGDSARVTFWDLTTGKVTREWTGTMSFQGDLQGAGVPEGGLSPDGRRILVHFSRSLNQAAPFTWTGVFDARTGRRVGHWPRPRALGPVFSPDGRALAYPYAPAVGVELWEVASGQRRVELGRGRQVYACAFSPDGRALAVGFDPGPVEVWDLNPSGAGPARKWDPGAADRLWELLEQLSGPEPFQAVCDLRSHPVEAVRLLKERVRVPTGPTAEWVARRINGLDAPAFRDRERATADLARLGDEADGPLRDALATASPEARERLKGLFAQPAVMTPEKLRAIRACEVLEGIGTPEARALLAVWAKGAPGATLTREAAESLERLKDR